MAPKETNMKNTITVLALIFSLAIFGQTSKQHFDNGISKHEKQDFEGAIKAYSKAIKADKKNKDAFFNRGSCKLALKDYSAAMKDFDKTIKLDPKFAKAYYSRATVFVSQQKYAKALPDLDKTVELNPTIPNVLTLRGQIRAQTGNKEGACEDFTHAKKIDDAQADKYLSQFCGVGTPLKEALMLDWPDSEKWKVGSNQENDQVDMIELIHSDETLENWTEMGTMMSIKGVKNVPMDKAMNMMYAEAKKKSSKAKLTFIEKDESVEHPWIIFIIESPSFKNDKIPESQLWYIIQGKTALYTNFRAVKKATISPNLKEKWIKFFKTGKVLDRSK